MYGPSSDGQKQNHVFLIAMAKLEILKIFLSFKFTTISPVILYHQPLVAWHDGHFFQIYHWTDQSPLFSAVRPISRGLKHHFWTGVIQYLWWVLEITIKMFPAVAHSIT
jgi:hypothetical protein